MRRRSPCAALFPYTTLFRSKEPGAKLLWRVDWPMRWAFEGVDYEPGGKDHSSMGGSFDTGSEIVRQVWKREPRSEEHTSELQSRFDLVCRLLLEKKKSHRPT